MITTILAYLSVFAFMYSLLANIFNVAANIIRAMHAIHHKAKFKSNFVTIHAYATPLLAVAVAHFWF